MDWMQWGLNALNGNDAASEERRERELDEEQRLGRIARGRAAFDRAGGSSSQHAGMQGAASMVGQGLANHAASAGQINQAIGTEMQSRVAQLREQRRMEHEKELMRMRLESQKQDQEGAMIRAILGGR